MTAQLTWLVGPPGAGKSTWAEGRVEHVVELTDMLGPLVDAHRIRRGVLTANSRLVEVIRAVVLHPDNRALPPTLVVAGIVPEEALFPLSDAEEVWLMLPERARWERQLGARPPDGGASGQYDDLAYSRLWYDRFATWPGRLPVRRVDVAYRDELLGKVVRSSS